MTTLPRVDLRHDPRILRTAVQLNTQNLGDFGNLPCVGVYADVVKPGRIRRGDPVRVGD
jgi:MOSC domain-containing protein YiiM